MQTIGSSSRERAVRALAWRGRLPCAGAVEACRRMEGYGELIRVKATGHLAVPTRISVRARGLPVLAPGNARGKRCRAAY